MPENEQIYLQDVYSPADRIYGHYFKFMCEINQCTYKINIFNGLERTRERDKCHEHEC